MSRLVKPRYVDPVEFGGGRSLSFRPPFLFRNATARVFPLKANIARLQQFVDEYLNMDVPDEIVHFAPAAPYVYLMALNYGGMSVSTVDALRMGWVAQHETFFYIPLERWRRENGKLEFKGWTGVSPFMFVDNPVSMTIGREVFGWPKTHAVLDASRSSWTTHPRAPERLLTLSAPMFGKTFAGEREPLRVLLTVERAPEATLLEFPLDARSPWFGPNAMADLWRNSLGFAQDALDMAARLRMRGYPDHGDASSLAAMAREGASLLGDMMQGLWSIPLPGGAPRNALMDDLPRYFASTINLKQFRDPSAPDCACYSALIESAMGVERINQAGLLGEANWRRGDSSGGYSVGIARYQAEPIVDTLGLETPPEAAKPREGDVVRLTPMFPFWMDFDLYYGAGEAICSRSPELAGGEWVEEVRADGRRDGVRRGRAPRRGAKPHGYNTALGAATLPVAGPVHYPDMTIEVFPLLANPAKLKAFLDWYWNDLFEAGEAQAKLRLEPMGSHVYLTVSIVGDAYGKMWSPTENIGWWADREVAFVMPVRWYEEGRLIGVAMIEPLLLADKPRAVATDREVVGRNCFRAAIDSPPDVWTSPGGPRAPRRLTRVATQSFVEPGYGLPATTDVLMEIDERPPLTPSEGEAWRLVADGWGRRLAEELHRKTGAWTTQKPSIEATQALALQALAQGAPLHRLTLKQHRDAAEFDRACYQAVVHTERRIDAVHEIGEIAPAPHVALHRLPSWPIVETLGLEIKHVRSDAQVIEYLEPIRPFWLRVAATDALGRIVATVDPHRAKASEGEPARYWTFKRPPPPGFEGVGRMTVGAHVTTALREAGAGDLKQHAELAIRRALVKEICWLRQGEGKVADDLATLPTAALVSLADELAARAAPLLELPSLPRATELHRLAHFAVGPQAAPSLNALGSPQARALGEALLAAFVIPERETHAGLRAASAARLYDLHAALHQSGAVDWRDEDAEGPSPTSSSLIDLIKRVEAWLIASDRAPAAQEAFDQLRIARFVAEYGLEPERLALLEQAFDAAARAGLETLAGAAWGLSFAEQQRAYHDARSRGRPAPLDPTAPLRLAASSLARDVADWLEPARFLRMTRGEAKLALEALPDLQLVFEAILDDGWQSRAAPRSAPRARMPAASVGPYGAPESAWGAEQGLTRLGEAEFVAAEGAV